MFSKSQLKPRNEYLYLFGTGGLYLYATAQTIIAATYINVTPMRLYLLGLLCLVFFTAILFNRVTRIATLVVLVLAALFILWRTELREAVYYHFSDVAHVVMGYLHHRRDLMPTLMWLILLALSFVTVIFMLYKFSFSVLGTIGVVIVALSWLSSPVRYTGAFFIFLFVFLLIFIRRMSGRIDAAALAAPLAVVVIFIANLNVPIHSEAFTRRTLREAFEGRITAIEDFLFEFFNPMYFSFAQTGFAGGGGRLGGPVTLNHNPVMDVYAPGMIYLSGATHNYFTGYAWRSTLQEGAIYTHGLLPGHFEMLENIAGLLYGGHFARGNSQMNDRILRTQFPYEPAHHLNAHNFVTVPVYADELFAPRGLIPRQIPQPDSGIIVRYYPYSDDEFNNVLPYLFDHQDPYIIFTYDIPYNIPYDAITELIEEFIRELDFAAWLFPFITVSVYAGESDTRIIIRYNPYGGDNFYNAVLSFLLDSPDQQVIFPYDMPYDAISGLTEAFMREFNFPAWMYPHDLIGDYEPDLSYIYWLYRWLEDNPAPGDSPRPDHMGRVRYFLHVYLPIETVSIGLGRNRTGTIFRPGASRNFWFDPVGFNYAPLATVSPMGDIRAPGFMRRGTVYHHQFLHINPEMELMAELLHTSYAGLYAGRRDALLDIQYELNPHEIDMAFAELTPHMMDSFLSGFGDLIHGGGQVFWSAGPASALNHLAAIYAGSVLVDYAESIRAHFMQVPDTVPQRVHDLTHRIIRYEETDFGRVMAIRDFLSTAFTYTLTPVPVPRGVCFVDFFLFEGQEGYCTYFASAMAIMSRIAGVPSRYVEGFFVQGEDRHVNTVTTVTNRMAHAWAEVYLEGFGWITIEATPPYMGALMEQAPPAPRPIIRGDGWNDELYWVHPDDDYTFFPGFNGGAATPGTGIVDATPERPVSFYAIVFGAAAGTLALLVILLFLLTGHTRTTMALRRVAKLNTNDRTQAYFKGILSISEYYHLQMQTGETTLAYARRAGKRFAFQSDSVFLRDLIALYNHAKYSSRTITEQEAALMQSGYFDMLALLKQMRRNRFFYLHYVRKIGAV